MTMLGKVDGASADDGTSYLELVSFLKSNGAAPKMDLVELWKRIVFNMAVSNTDDHLRNHGFILTQTGWRLSPLYDVNPVPYGEDLALNVSEDDSRISFDLAIETAQYYGITQTEAEKIVEEISTTVRDNWERLASEYGLCRGSIEKMCPAFSACYE
jgi:serine/threonine-protein kinase HipA